MDNSRSDGDPTSGGVATIPDSSSIASSRMSAMVAAAQSPQPLSAAYAGRSPAETHGYLMGRNMVGRNMVLQMMIDHNPRHCVTQRGPIAAMPPPVGNPKQDDAIPKIRKRKASPASSPSKKAKLKEPPAGLKTDPEEEQRKETEGDSGGDNSCCICMCEPEPMEASTIDGCAHKFCFSCIDKWSDRENTCPLCKERFANITRVTKHPRGARGEDGEKPKNSKKVKNRDQRADLNPGGNPLEALLANMGGMSGSFHPSIARLFFSGIGPAGIQVGLEMSAGLPRPQPPSVGAAWRARTDEQNWLSEDEMEEEDDGFDAFVNRMRGNRGGPGTIFGGFAPSGQVRQQAEQIQDTRSTAAIQQRFHASLAARRARAVAADGMPPLVSHPFAPRNFASNHLQVGAGATAQEALEICGSDSDDDEIEVLEVTQGRSV